MITAFNFLKNHLVIIIIFEVFTGKLYGQIFNGEIRYHISETYNQINYERFKVINQLKGKKVIEIDYINSLNKDVKYQICGDTLIQFYLASNGDTSMINVQLKRDVFIGWPDFFRFNNKSAINTVKDWKKIKSKERILGIETTGYKGITKEKSTEFILCIDPNVKYLQQAKNEYSFSNVFSEYGVISKEMMEYYPSQFKKTTTVTEISPLSCSCQETLNKIGFSTESKKETVTIDDLLVKNGKDTTLIEEKDRQLLSFQGQNMLSENVNLDSIQGTYTLIDLWATWCGPCIIAMPALGDIYEKYRYDGLKVVSVSLDGVSATVKWKKTIEDEHMYWNNYLITEGFDSELCKQLNIKAIPHYILLDPEGRIMLENAPGPSDPNLTLVLNRLLIGKK